ncbi:S41 family peptidase [Algoriphagus yeomjeoni]|uniref:Peptidase S41-like protein n=1 Tax=Algoriphagus yeomjeoni TaxID=291403 RepID=A0A327PIS5_9BACT|nr:S41 family peptidase [Algoriphagus yeomjeoni]RAI92185.1 peptidase S41-like protein [Algoriphagus yeomjeoni]
MKKVFILMLLLNFNLKLAAQPNCDCASELDFVYEQVQTTASFKDQIRGEKKAKFEENYLSLRAQMNDELSKLDCFWALNQLMYMVQDKHVALTENPLGLSEKSLQDSSFLAGYRDSHAFKNFPKTDRNVANLAKSLEGKRLDEVEGIYKIGSKLKMGVYRVTPDSLVGVILSSQVEIWEPGQIFAYLKHSNIQSHYDIIHYGTSQKNLKFSKAQFFDHGMLFPSVLKEDLESNYAWIDKPEEEAYQLSNLTDDVQYVWLNSFNRVTKPAERDALIAEIPRGLTAKNLIIDLRNNGGGADKISLPILKELKKKKVNIYVLTNFFTGSNAEMTTVRLKDDFDAVQLGQRTYGAISYGSNYGKSYNSPSGLFNFYPTDMRQREFIAYEEVGVQPDIKLNQESDWVRQTVEYIQSVND